MNILRKYSLYALSFCMAAVMMLVPIRVDAASENISYLDEIQSVSSGDLFSAAATYSMMKLNEDYGVVAAAVLPNSITNVSTTFSYTPSFDTSTEVLSFTLLEQEIDISNTNWIEFNLPINISSSSSYVKITDYNLWVLLNGNKYYLGKGPVTSKIHYDLGHSFGYFVFGVDVQVNCSQSNDFPYDMVIDGQLIDGTLNGTYYDSTGKYYSDFSADPNFIINESYLDQLIENRASSSVISISWYDASYLNGYIKSEVVSWLNDIYSWIRNVYQNISDTNSWLGSIYQKILDTNSWLSSIYQNITTSNDWLNNVYNRIGDYGNRIIDKLTELTSGYQGTGTTDAANQFDTSAGELESVESDLTSITNSSIGSYTDTAFDTSVITSLGSSLVYVVTWFTNFWNMGGLFTSILNVGLALSVAFFILRLRGGS